MIAAAAILAVLILIAVAIAWRLIRSRTWSAEELRQDRHL